MKIAKTGFWAGNAEDYHKFDKPLADALTVLFKDRSVIDMGCGEGRYVEHFNNTGIDCIGYDGNPNTKYENCYVQDLTKRFYPPIMYDTVLSLEVGEHIPADLTKKYIANIKRNKPALIVISWAIPGQGGDGHVNELPNKDVIDMFAEYTYDNSASQALRNSASLWWFKNTIMVFVKHYQAHNKH
jgi:cyclopropane fatty-acyl-phospholipid synthase-like methyltransferase